MEITCKTNYDRKTLAAMSLAARKTLRRRFDRLVRIYLWVVVALMAVSLWLSLDEPPSAALYAVFIALLVVIQLRQDAINAFFAHRRQVPGCEVSLTVFHPDCYVVTFLPGLLHSAPGEGQRPRASQGRPGGRRPGAVPGFPGGEDRQARPAGQEVERAMSRGKKAVFLGALALCLGGLAWYRRTYRMPLKEYTRRALYMALLDDEICRNELEGNIIGGEEIRFPPKAESLHYRYRLYLSINRGKNRRTLQIETARMERRLEESRQYLNRPQEELTVSVGPLPQ